MFTGIVQTTGTVVAVDEESDGLRMRIAAEELDDLHHGQSVSVSGVCLTVEEYGDGNPTWFEVFLAAETVARTYLDRVAVGDELNVELAMAADDRFDGHVVQGHVDATAEVVDVERVGEDWRFGFELPAEYDRYVVEKGSIALDGISLTVAEKRGSTVEVAIVPTTYELTTLSEKEPGDPVHLEVDVLAKYVESLLEGDD